MAARWQVEEGEARAGRHYPGSWPQFEAWFGSEDAARAYVEAVRFEGVVACVRCGSRGRLRRRPGSIWWCGDCRRTFSVTMGTVFEHTRVPLLTWLRAIWLVGQSKAGVSAVTLANTLGLNYTTAWHMLHKLRAAMDQDNRARLSGRVEVDETIVGGVEAGRSGRSRGTKQLVVIAVESPEDEPGFGRARMARVYNESATCLRDFIEANIEPGSTLVTDGLAAYATVVRELRDDGCFYAHQPIPVARLEGQAHEFLPGVHRLAALVKRVLLSTHQGAVEAHQLDAYLDEYVFRFNRRSSNSRGLLFYRLLTAALATPPVPRPAVTARRAELTAGDKATKARADADKARRNRDRVAQAKAKKKTATKAAAADPEPF
jgi:transposase-like protein